MAKPRSEKYTQEYLDTMKEKQDLARQQGLIDDRGVRTKLEKIEEVRDSFYGTFKRCGRATTGKLTVLIVDIRNKHGNIIADHVWFNLTKGFKDIGFMSPGEMLRFDARVRKYEKGYKGQKDDILARNGGLKEDYKLSHPSKIKRYLGKPGQRLATIDNWDKQKRLDHLSRHLQKLEKKHEIRYSWKEYNNI